MTPPVAANSASSRPASAAPSAGRATLMVMVFVMLSRVLGVVRDIAINHFYGRGIPTDIYTAAFRIPDVLQYLVAGGALATVFVPVFTEYWEKDQKKDAWRVFGTVISVVAVIAALLVVIMEFLAGPLARWMNPAIGIKGWMYSPEEMARQQEDAWHQVAALSRILLPAQWCFFVGGLMMGTLNARKNFLIPAVGPLVYNGGIIVAAIFFNQGGSTLAPLCWGAFIAACLGNFLLPVVTLIQMKAPFILGFDLQHPGVRKVGQLMIPALLGLSLSQLGFWITGNFTNGVGALSSLRIAYNLTQAPIGIFAQASAIVIFPTIAALAAREEWSDFRREIHYGIRRILFLTVPASVLMAALAEPLVTAVYMSGKFTPADATATAAVLGWYSLGTFAWSAQAVLARGFYARQNSKTPVIITTSMVFTFVVLCMVLPHLFPPTRSFLGLALALSIAGTLNMLIFFWRLQVEVGKLSLRTLGIASTKITLAALAGGGVALLYLKLFWHGPQSGRMMGLMTVILAGAAALAVYLGACLVLNVSELKTIRTMFQRRKTPTNA
ncbi:MAG: murein biosynthesis integral membrane protein MurJ [Armatimonas sp.]